MKISKSGILVALMFLGVLTTMQYSSLVQLEAVESPIFTEKQIDDLLQNDEQLKIFMLKFYDTYHDINLLKIEHGKTLLQKLARAGKYNFVYACWQMGADVNAQDDNGWTALHNAVLGRFHYSLDVVKFLVDNGADVTIRDNRGRNIIDFVHEYSVAPAIAEYIDSFAQVAEFQIDSNPEVEEYPESLSF